MRLRYKKKEFKRSRNSFKKMLRLSIIRLEKAIDRELNKPKRPLMLILTNNMKNSMNGSINDK